MAINLDIIRTHLRDELQPDPRERGKYLCPICSSGSQPGANHDGAFSVMDDGVHGHCFACGFHGDIFDLEAARTGLPLSEATKAVLSRYGLSGFSASPAADFETAASAESVAAPVAPAPSFSGQIEAWHSALKGSEGEAYLRRRGITGETMERFRLGFGTDLHGNRAIVFPYNRQGTYYSMRAISDSVSVKHTKPRTDEAGSEPIFNPAALYQNDPCFIVESQLCAISIAQEGGSAIAIGGTSGINKIRALKDTPSALLILSLDNDEPGQTAQAKLAEILQEKEYPFFEFNVAGDCKDPNELLQRDPAALRGSIAAAVEVAKSITEQEAEKERTEYEAQTTAASFSRFEEFLEENAGRPPIPTGFSSLDRTLNGGLTAGLYIMGAISSLGKTSWMLNIADNIAAAGRDVLYFSLEMSRNELIAKSISRLSFEEIRKAKAAETDAFTTFGVLSSRSGKTLSFGQNGILEKAFRAYREGPGQHIWIFEGVGAFGVPEIAQKVEDHLRITGRTPVVFIDYLQILAPDDPRATDKQNTDKAVVELKRLSAKYDLPIFSISSLNRQNYENSISMASFKESGAIEYGSDVLIGVQLAGIDYDPEKDKSSEKRKARVQEIVANAEKSPQVEIEVRVLKNRNGSRGGSGRLLFEKRFNHFSEIYAGFTRVTDPTPFEEDAEQDGENILLI